MELTVAPVAPPAPPPPRRPREPLAVLVARASLATVVAGLICVVILWALPSGLSGEIDIVGYPTFANFDYRQSFWAYQLAVLVVPVLSAVLYGTLARWGPLRRRDKRGRSTVFSPRIGALEEEAEPRHVGPVARTLRILLPTSVVVLAASAREGRVDALAVGCGALYLLLLLAAAAVAKIIARRRGTGSIVGDALAVANGLGGAAAALVGLWLVSRSTVVFTPTGPVSWDWLPPWLALGGVAACGVWVWRCHNRRTPPAVVEHILLSGVVGAVAVFLATSQLPGPLGPFQGFDDSYELAGASLLSRGYVPWRDLLFIHGLFPDVLRGTLGAAVFGDTRWGVVAGGAVLLAPLTLVSLYLLAAWVTRGSAWFLAGFGVAAIGAYILPLDIRFMLVPITLIMLGETLRRSSARWCIALAVLLFVQGVLVPETAFLALPVLACVLGYDLMHRQGGQGLGAALRRILWVVGTGVVATLALVGALLSLDALRPFIDYYLIFGPGHNEAGALPLTGTGVGRRVAAYWVLGAVAVMATLWCAAAQIGDRRQWGTQMWVALAAAGFLAFYELKALGRFDVGHIAQVFTVALPLLVIWAWTIIRSLDRFMPKSAGRWPGTWRLSAVIGYTGCAVLVVMSSTVWPTLQSIPIRHRVVAPEPVDRLGYVVPGAVDTQMIDDLDVVLRTYAGPDAPVFDMTNSLGYYYYLLGREPGTRFAHVSMAIPPYAQEILIDELRESRPPVVVFDSTRIGLPSWDEIANDVRHYEVSEYILDHWVPVVRTHGNLILVREDLYRPEQPVPALHEPPVTSELWFSGRSCDWGASANFLESPPAGRRRVLPVRSLGELTVVQASGWAVDPVTGVPAQSVLLVEGDVVVDSVAVTVERTDIPAVVDDVSLISGFDYAKVGPATRSLTAYARLADGTVHPIGDRSLVDKVTMPDGTVLPVAPSPVGELDALTSTRRLVGQIDVPADLDPYRYDLMTLSADGEPLGDADVTVTDVIGDDGHAIRARSLASDGQELAVRVGSCLQWHGYQPGRPLYVVQEGRSSVTSVTLSGVDGS